MMDYLNTLSDFFRSLLGPDARAVNRCQACGSRPEPWNLVGEGGRLVCRRRGKCRKRQARSTVVSR